MNRNFNLRKFIGLPSFSSDSHPEETPFPRCSGCGYIADRPHALQCLRCGTPFPGAQGCSNCGRCRRK